MIIILFSFSNAFYLIARNQTAGQSQAVIDNIEYATFTGSFLHVYRLALGDFNLDMYSEGNDNYLVLIMFWTFASFLLLIHLLNMLIAIMGETFSVNNEVKDVQMLRSHLQFVMDNWWINPIEDKATIKYLITAFLKEDESQE